MTDYKYSSNNFSSCVNEKINNPSVAAAMPAPTTGSNGTRKQPPRLKKSHSECEYYDNSSHSVPNEPYNLSPAKRKRKEHNAVVFEQGQSLRSSQSTGKHNQSSSKNEVGFVEGDVMQSYDKSYDKMRYQQDTLKSQYLLQQQQKLKEYKNDPNYSNSLSHHERYSSESSTDLRSGSLKHQKGSDSNKSSLKRNKHKQLSSLSLCSCDADSEVIPNQSRPLYQYSLDRKKPLHTYTCEQNAQILLRLEKEHHKKYGSYGRLHFTTPAEPDHTQKQQPPHPSKKDDNKSFEYPLIYPETNYFQDEQFIENLIPPPPPTLKRMSSLKINQQLNGSLAVNATNHQTQKTMLDQSMHDSTPNKPDLFNFANNNSNPNTIDRKHKLTSDNNNTISGANHQASSIKSAQTKTAQANGNNCPNKLSYPFYVDDNFHQQYDKENLNSFYLYHQDPISYLPNYDNIPLGTMTSKFNTSDCGGMQPQCNKFHLSSCNLNNQLKSSNLISGQQFSNSLSNFDFSNPHQAHNCYNFNQPYTKMSTTMHPEVNGIGGYGSSSLMGSSFASNISLNVNTKPNQWKQRQCSRSGSSSSGTNSSKWDLPSRQWLALTSILLLAGAAGVAVPFALSVTASASLEERLQAATQLLDTVPLIDGHNDLPWNIRKFLHNQLNEFNFDEDLRQIMPWAKSPWSHTDLQRLKRGRVAAQFWAAYVPCEAQYRDAVQITLEQIDVINRLTERYSPQLMKCTSVYDIQEAHKNHHICSLIGVEGGHSLGGSLGVLRIYYSLGVRYMTLTSTCHTPWADSSNADAPKFDVKHGGLTNYGKIIIKEMNRLGMMIDLSKASVNTMKGVLAISDAPVIFSHSSAFKLCNSSRNVQDEILQMIAKNRGLVMVNFYSKFLSCSENSSVYDAIAHINHIKRTAGIDHVGLGAGYDGINFTPRGLEDVSTYPMLFAELTANGWTVEEMTKLAGGNLLRVLAEVERVRDAKRLVEQPFEDIPNFRLPTASMPPDEQYNCTNNIS